VKRYLLPAFLVALLLLLPCSATNLYQAPLPIDAISQALVVIDHEEHKLHDGLAYTTHYAVAATGATKMTCIGFITPGAADGFIHLTAEAQADEECVFRIVKDPSVDLGEGTDLIVFNRNDSSARTANIATIEATPDTGLAYSYTDVQAAGANITISAANTLHFETIGQTGHPAATFGGTSRGTQEIILNPNSQYIVILTRSTANATFCEIELNFYEHVRYGL
jgi:hypothetical protein